MPSRRRSPTSIEPGVGALPDTIAAALGDHRLLGPEVCTFNRTILIAKRGHSVEDKINY